ncbi:hypothetical protein [Streptomyces sp. NBC_00151]|uniref:hypothetical protein n=1 Tax=Streptomyces sp. NBC_00151 TaxID=2975669 RepID=UPI002DD9205B|nr:hypothetical protein [Streptomyces sp. NBC_00151]WRZ39938.1 hypothetical protein OG915_18955 [Streptomyces sp. NBC_00151]
MPGLCRDCGADKERYAKVDGPEDDADDGCVLQLVDEYAGGMVEEPSYDLSGELPPDFQGCSLPGLTVLTEVAQRKLDMEGRTTEGPWRLWWQYCDSEVVGPQDETEDGDSSGDDLDETSAETCSYVLVHQDDDGHTVEVVRMRGEDEHVMYQATVPELGQASSQDTETLEGLEGLLERVARQVHDAVGCEVQGEWTVNWSRCHVRLSDSDY